MSLNESTVEGAALEWFGELGYAIGHGPDLAPGDPAPALEVMTWIKGEASVEAVRRFVEKKGARMAYTVAMDDPETGPIFTTG